MGRPLAERPLAFVDVETTGLDPSRHEILDIAVVFDVAVAAGEAERRRMPNLEARGDIAFYSTRVKPTHIETAHPKALEVNGYAKHPELWLHAPTFDEIAPDVADVLDGAVLVGHNVKFDHGFISEALARAGVDGRLDYHVIDTVTLVHEHLVPCGLHRVGLEPVREFFGMPKDGAHTALQDAIDARTVYKRLSRASRFHRLWWWARHRLRAASRTA